MHGRPSEDQLIARYFVPLAGEGGLSLADDAALFRPRPGCDLVLTVDAIVAGVHFFADDPPDSIAAKALGVNLSDIAAKGAAPAGFLLTLALPDDWTEPWLARFCAGLGEAAREGRCPLLGGDTVRAAGPLTVSVTMLGEVPEGRMVRRTTARVGDLLCVTGTVGDAALGLALQADPPPDWAASLQAADRDFLIARYRRPQPRFALASALRDHASAAMDVSDGLAGDLAKMMRSAEVTATVDLDALPLSPATRSAVAVAPNLIGAIATGGDDYEILCTLPDHAFLAFEQAAGRFGIALSVIGKVEAGTGPPRFFSGGRQRTFEQGSYGHFRS